MKDCHGCASYITARDSLIPLAEIAADDFIIAKWGWVKMGEWTEEQENKWNREYHAAMDRLVKERGL